MAWAITESPAAPALISFAIGLSLANHGCGIAAKASSTSSPVISTCGAAVTALHRIQSAPG